VGHHFNIQGQSNNFNLCNSSSKQNCQDGNKDIQKLIKIIFVQLIIRIEGFMIIIFANDSEDGASTFCEIFRSRN
jgi:hypothetical protein